MIRIQGLSKKFLGQFILKDIELFVQTGEIVVIGGPSGSGKSTFLRCINWLEKPCSGEIWIDQVRLTPLTIDTIRTQIGLVFQGFHLFPHMRVLKNLIYAPMCVLGLSKKMALEKAENLLERVGLFNKKNVYPYMLSGGQKQRIAIVRALMMDPKILLLDEPTSALDEKASQEFLKMIQKFAELNMTILIATHEIGLMQSIAHRVLFLEHTKIVEKIV